MRGLFFGRYLKPVLVEVHGTEYAVQCPRLDARCPVSSLRPSDTLSEFATNTRVETD